MSDSSFFGETRTVEQWSSTDWQYFDVPTPTVTMSKNYSCGTTTESNSFIAVESHETELYLYKGLVQSRLFYK